jgi:methylated-DNA-[protein]-cysteine S-methyltransferase
MISAVNRPIRAHRLTRPRLVNASTHERMTVLAFPTDLDWMAVAWRDDALQGIVFGYAMRRHAEIAVARALKLPPQFFCSAGAGQPSSEPTWIEDLIAKLQGYAEGKAVDFSEVPLALNHLTPFARRVVEACRRIPRGQARTYGQLAAICGSPGAARAVGSVMAKNRFPLVVPCHRVLAAGGELGGYSAPDGLRMKRRLLAMEGVNLLQAV